MACGECVDSDAIRRSASQGAWWEVSATPSVQWTHELPKEDGWYWFRAEGELTQPVLLNTEMWDGGSDRYICGSGDMEYCRTRDLSDTFTNPQFWPERLVAPE